MIVRMFLKTGHIVPVPNVEWHPVHASAGCGQALNVPEGMWVRESEIARLNSKYNEFHKKYFPDTHVDRSLPELYDLIGGAEAPFSVMRDSDSPEPWRDFGNVVAEVRYCADFVAAMFPQQAN